jgi:hypothetical protein
MCLRHHGGTSLLPTNRNLYGRVMQCIKSCKIAFAGNAKKVFDTVKYQLINEDLPASSRR